MNRIEIYSRIIKDYQHLLILMNNLIDDSHQENILLKIDNKIADLKDFIKDMEFIDNRECYEYKVAKEKLELLENIISF